MAARIAERARQLTVRVSRTMNAHVRASRSFAKYGMPAMASTRTTTHTWRSVENPGSLGTWTAVARRPLNYEQMRCHSDHGHSHGETFDTPKVGIKFLYEKDGRELPATGHVGMNVLRVAHANNIDLEGACECSLACSTCHVVLEEDLFDKLEEPTGLATAIPAASEPLSAIEAATAATCSQQL